MELLREPTNDELKRFFEEFVPVNNFIAVIPPQVKAKTAGGIHKTDLELKQELNAQNNSPMLVIHTGGNEALKVFDKVIFSRHAEPDYIFQHPVHKGYQIRLYNFIYVVATVKQDA
jgi:hypothetical protein